MPANRIAGTSSTVDFFRLDGIPVLPGLRLKPVEKMGVDGIAFKAQGRGAQLFQAQALAYVTGTLETAIRAIMSFEGDQVTWYDAQGMHYTGVVITKVDIMSQQTCGLTVTGASSSASSVRVVVRINGIYPYGSF